jgi:hypothetical protein
MADGRSIEVVHRDFVARSPTGRTVIIFGKDGLCLTLKFTLIMARVLKVPYLDLPQSRQKVTGECRRKLLHVTSFALA